ncbi:glutamate--cysteine ligase [Buchnera aphidicola]|uniref:glutamate--cysteine ligase n=1 Tax=Buchnera aphidicola TaxID=9 RepID=UPI0016514B95|nr:glutamate--cysteine ligase [Buchnera aphidicola]
MIFIKLKELNWIKKNKEIFTKIFRGIERETLRVNSKGKIVSTTHPKQMGKSLTHQWITTDYSENLLEFITPKTDKLKNSIQFLQDLYIYATKNIYPKERMWPLSIPLYNIKKDKVKLAKFGNSNIGKVKELYRKGLQKRYGNFMNIISGIHYNFSFPIIFWKKWKKIKNNDCETEIISNGYLGTIRNYYRIGWIIPYLFGASPAVSNNSYDDPKIKRKLTKNKKKNFLYFPWGTSIRISKFGHQNKYNKKFKISYNNINDYINSVIKILSTNSKSFKKIKEKDKKGKLNQLNTNIIQLENELYTQIRPKSSVKNNEKIIDSMKKKGIEYIEIRSLDINPFSEIGIEKKQILFLDLLLILCTFLESPSISNTEWKKIQQNWETVAIYGRKPNQKIFDINSNTTITLKKIGISIFCELKKIAKILDISSKEKLYENTCLYLENLIKYPQFTYSARVLKKMKKKGILQTGLNFANFYYKKNINKKFQKLSNDDFVNEAINSQKKQKNIEKKEQIPFHLYLKEYTVLNKNDAKK